MLTVSLIASKFVLEAIVDFEWPLLVYVADPRDRSATARRWCGAGTSAGGGGPARSRTDIGLDPQWADIGWGPVIWLAALGAQIADGGA